MRSGSRPNAAMASAIRHFARIALGSSLLVARQGINGFYTSVDARHACCAVRKVEPLRLALVGAAGWITGLRAGQSDERAAISFATASPGRIESGFSRG
jgi:phosphoadenosine phosphosulfate reductase